jgi:5-methyltetrahydrofolate--homocysteine methyltransferase
MHESMTVTELSAQRILMLDGAMGTMIQSMPLRDEDFMTDGHTGLRGCNEVLNLSRPDLIGDIHLAYLRAGAHIVETNTFGANRFSLAEYGLDDHVHDLNLAGAEIARFAVERFTEEHPGSPAYVAGVVGPSGKSASLSPSVDDPAFRDVVFSDFVDAFSEQIGALLDGNVDLLLIETVFDTLVAKAALVAATQTMESRGRSVPLMVSATFSDKSGRTLSGQTLEAFVDSLSSFPLFSLGLNCSTGPQEMIPLVERLAACSPFRTSAHPNAGFPDGDGIYSQSPGRLASLLEPVVARGLLNIVGGCCGTTPDHIAALAEIAGRCRPRGSVKPENRLRLSGLDSMRQEQGVLTIVGERTNVAGSKKFARLIRERSFDEALSIAKSQIAQGARIMDICMDDAMIDAIDAMVTFIRLASADPSIARVPFMIDSSDWDVITAALQEMQGRGVVNSISLKEGEAQFIQKARHIVSMGAARVVMLFDEQGQADTFERKIEIARRSYRLLVGQGICDPSSIIFDPNVLAIATGIDAHDRYASDFIRAVAWIKSNLPGVSVSGGISNLSFSFRGNNSLREAMHAVFLSYAVDSGLDMAIMNPATMIDASTIDPQVLAILERVLLADGEDVVADRDALIDLATRPLAINQAYSGGQLEEERSWRSLDLSSRLSHALLRGEDSFLAQDLEEASSMDAVSIIEGPLMAGMTQVGQLFGEGKLFLPQVVRSARIMKRAVDILRPRLEDSAAGAGTAGTILLATVKGDVHDIGKNIVALVLRCNNLKVVDLGVMVPPEDILAAARAERADIVGLSGLITPSLSQMAALCRLFAEEGMHVPVMVGGATTSEEHTAMRLEPLYQDSVFHSTDASDAVRVALRLLSDDSESFKREIAARYTGLREQRKPTASLMTVDEALRRAFIKRFPAPEPLQPGVHIVGNIPVKRLEDLINWPMLCRQWRVPTGSSEGERLINEAEGLLHDGRTGELFASSLKAVVGVFEARSGDGKTVRLFEKGSYLAEFRFLRSQSPGRDGLCRSLADYIHQSCSDTIGLFVATSGSEVARQVERYREQGEEYLALLLQTLADRMVEALSEYLQEESKRRWWAFGEVMSIRPAIGYPSAPDHVQKSTIFSLLRATEHIGVRLTEGYAMDPVSSVCGFHFAGEGVSYFSPGALGKDQLADYAAWRGIGTEQLADTLSMMKE